MVKKDCSLLIVVGTGTSVAKIKLSLCQNDCGEMQGIMKKFTAAILQRIKRHYCKQLLDEVFVISRIIKVEVGVISRSRTLPRP